MGITGLLMTPGGGKRKGITHTHSLGCMSEREKLLGQERVCCCREIIFMFSGFTFGAHSISKEVAGFSPFMVSSRINIVFIVSCV